MHKTEVENDEPASAVVAEATAGGFPAISAAPCQFLLKDLVLLAASLSLLLASVQGPWLNVQKS
jgi:reactive chlorine resistance protein C